MHTITTMPKKALSALIVATLLLQTVSYADCWQVGTCRSLNKLYKEVEFKVDQCSDLTETVELVKDKHGILTKDGNDYSVIYSNQVPAPESQYIDCNRAMEEG